MPDPGAILCGVCMIFLWLRGFFPGNLVSSRSRNVPARGVNLELERGCRGEREHEWLFVLLCVPAL